MCYLWQVGMWIYPILGFIESNEANTAQAKVRRFPYHEIRPQAEVHALPLLIWKPDPHQQHATHAHVSRAWLGPPLATQLSHVSRYLCDQLDVDRALAVLEAKLIECTFLVGEAITLADIVTTCSLINAFKVRRVPCSARLR